MPSDLRFGIIGLGLMGREFASAAARWIHLNDFDVRPVIVAVCDTNETALGWFKSNIPTINFVTTDYRQLLSREDIDAIYCAVPHNLHEQFYCDIISAGKHLLGEKPFGIDLAANRKILETIQLNPKTFVRCSSELPFYPGGIAIVQALLRKDFGQIVEVECGLLHSSDINPQKAINWKRMTQFNGKYGCMGDLGMHVLHIPLRFGWFSTKYPRTLQVMEYEPGGNQAWQQIDLGYQSAYPTITGSIFEFGFTDAILQMWAAFCDELAHGREKMRQPFYCVTPDETHQSHLIFTQALASYAADFN
jgi:hypothetical protein